MVIVRAMASGAAASLGDEPRRPAKLALVVVVVARGVGDRLCCDSGIASGRGMPRPGVSVRPWKVGSSPAWVMRRFRIRLTDCGVSARLSRWPQRSMLRKTAPSAIADRSSHSVAPGPASRSTARRRCHRASVVLVRPSWIFMQGRASPSGCLGIGRNRILFGNVFDAQAGDFAAATAAGYQRYDPVGAKVSRQGARPGWRVQSARAYGRGGNTSGGGRVAFEKLVGSILHPREF